MFKLSKPIFFLLAFVLIVWPVNAALYVWQARDTNQHARLVSSDEFLMGLHNRVPDGCVALGQMSKTDIIVVGSSHAYANIDPYVLSQSFKGQSIAVCGLPAWNSDYFSMFVEFLDKQHLSPKRIIWLVDQSSPLRLVNQPARSAYARSVLFDTSTQQKTIRAWTQRLEAGEPSLGLDSKTYEDRLSRHRAQLSELFAPLTAQLASRVVMPSFPIVKKAAQTAKPNPLDIKNLQQMCRNFRQRSIALDVVVSPLPQMTEAIFENENGVYTQINAESLSTYYNTHLPCMRRIVEKPLQAWGLDQRHFLNRNLMEDYPYELWKSAVDFETKYQSLPKHTQAGLYDLDHMNPVGAEIFTRELVRALNPKN